MTRSTGLASWYKWIALTAITASISLAAYFGNRLLNHEVSDEGRVKTVETQVVNLQSSLTRIETKVDKTNDRLDRVYELIRGKDEKVTTRNDHNGNNGGISVVAKDNRATPRE